MPETREFSEERIYMNTKVRIRIFSDLGTVSSRDLIKEAFSKFDYVTEKYTRFNQTSELSSLNRNSGHFHKVNPELFTLIEKLIQYSTLTEGAFDPTIIDLLEMYGFKKDSNYEELKDENLLKNIQTYLKTRPSFRDIKFDKTNSAIKLQAGQRIDLGSIGKGLAIDLAASVLEPVNNFIINAGGDIRAHGSKPDGPWTVGLAQHELPNKGVGGGYFGHINIINQSLAASGGWGRRVRFFHHLLNPKTGMPINEVSQTFTLANDAQTADVWATILFASGKQGPDLLDTTEEIEGMIVFADGSTYCSRGFSFIS
ncbi:MAG: FAD:protein FMN transferase [Candidatus Dojkabacteria bacterium]|nr:MAG: FAD:protein FMN transferase [Candidatus Dojkabacteria bacterium]